MSSPEYNFGRVGGEITTFESSVEKEIKEIKEKTIQFLKSKIKNFDTENKKHKKIFHLICLYRFFVASLTTQPGKDNILDTHRLYGLRSFYQRYGADFGSAKSLADLQYELETGHKLYLALNRLKDKKTPV